MREYILKISGGEDFIIITSQMLSALIFHIHELQRREFTVAVRDIVPRELEGYLVNIINTNRYAAPCFRYGQILEEPVTRRELQRILRQQLEGLELDRAACFRSVVLADTVSGEAGFGIACTEPFFWACKDTMARFVYFCPDGRREILVMKYGENGAVAEETS